MGTWALDFNTGLGAGVTSRFVNFAGNFFAFVVNTNAAGVWRRVGAGNWVRTIGPGNNLGRGEVWNGRMWWIQWDGANYSVYRSIDGINWVLDTTPAIGGNMWEAIGGFSSYLQIARRTVGTVEFYRRNTTGTWTAYPPATTLTNLFPTGVMAFSGKVHLSTPDGSFTWDGSSWTQDSPSLAACYFMVHSLGSIGNYYLWATPGNKTYRRSAHGNWMLDAGNPYGGSLGFSVDEDGMLYATNSTTSQVYARVGSFWHSQGGFVAFTTFAGCRDANGDLFAGCVVGGSTCFYIYTPDFNIAPGGLSPQAMDVDGDGDALYIGVYNAAAQPVLVKVALPLVNNAIGNAVFNPLAGTAINVKCGDVGGELAIAGSFAAAPGNEQVEVSEDGGGTWTDIDRDAWGVEVAEPLLVDPDDAANRVMVALAGAQDIVETTDGGATAWVINNAAVGYSPGAMAKLEDELIIGDDAANRIDYSPNRGVTLQNITGAFGGNPCAIEVV